MGVFDKTDFEHLFIDQRKLFLFSVDEGIFGILGVVTQSGG